MSIFNVPTKDEVSEKNKAILEQLESKLGFIPNIYATYAISDFALERYLTYSNAKTSLNNKEKEVVNLIVSQVNGCRYCLAAHTTVGKMNGFSDAEILELRKGFASFNEKFDALVKLAKSITENRGAADMSAIDAFFQAGYSQENLVDVVVQVGDKTTTNYLHKITNVPIDFPEAVELETV